MVDVTNVCNGKCIHCPQIDFARRDGYHPRFLDLDLFEKLMREVSGFQPEVVRITGDGEPLMHPELFAFLESARRFGVCPVNLTTNGSLLTAEALERLLSIGVDIVDVSLDALSAETYARIRPGLRFETVSANLHRLLALRDPGRTRVMVSIIRMKENEEEIDDFVQYWTPRVDRVLVRSLHSNRNYFGPGPSDGPAPARIPCPHLWKRLILDYRGRIKFCPVDWEGDSVVGDFRSRSLQEVWRSAVMERYREQHLAGAFSRVRPCGDCSDWITSPWDHGYEKAVRGVAKEPPAQPEK